MDAQGRVGDALHLRVETRGVADGVWISGWVGRDGKRGIVPSPAEEHGEPEPFYAGPPRMRGAW